MNLSPISVSISLDHVASWGLSLEESCPLSRSVMSKYFVTPWTVALQALLSMGFSRQEYWSGLPSPSPGNLLDPGIEPMSPALAGEFFTTETPGKPERVLT